MSPAVTVSPASDLDPNVENVITVTGTGFTGAGAANGAYVLFGETSVWSGGSALPADGWIALDHTDLVDGGFTKTLTIPKGSLDPSKTYQVATSAAHRLSATDRTLDTFTPVTVKKAALTPTVTIEGTPQAGASLTVSGSGFTAGQPVEVEVHSTPFRLGSATVEFDGRFTVTGALPADFPAGAHTVVAIVDGVELASAPVTVAAAAAPAPAVEAAPVATCTAQAVSGASISWGVKESFVSYVDGPIANGSASISWGSGSGAYNTSENLGRVNYGGSAVFTGHGGILDLTLSNPTIQVNGTGSASLSVVANGSRVTIATLSLPAASVSGGAISWRNAAATLTSAGAALFSYNGNAFYPAGTALDPVSFTFPLGAEVPCDASTSGELAATGGQPLDGTVWAGLGLLVLGAALVVARRRRTLVG